MRKTYIFRHYIQAIWAIITNCYLLGFVHGKIYEGNVKKVCVPGLNCYSCPGAIASCPIGALQAVIGSREFNFSMYVAGMIFLMGTLAGRFICGWLCPFGFVQDILYKIPILKKINTFKLDMHLRKLKYVILVVFVFLLPMFILDASGQGSPYFCKLICPAGTLEGALPLMLLNNALIDAVGWLFLWKNVILALTIILSIIIYRPFCKYICPLGAIYSLMNPVSVFRYKVDKNKCTNCGACSKVCKMNINPVQCVNSPECIRCGMCKNACNYGAIKYNNCFKQD